MQQMADVTWADGQVFIGLANYIYNRAAAMEALDRATSAYQSILQSSDDERLLNRAHLGLARVYEMQNELDKARDEYLKVDGGYAEYAKQQAERLAKPEAKETLCLAGDGRAAAAARADGPRHAGPAARVFRRRLVVAGRDAGRRLSATGTGKRSTTRSRSCSRACGLDGDDRRRRSDRPTSRTTTTPATDADTPPTPRRRRRRPPADERRRRRRSDDAPSQRSAGDRDSRRNDLCPLNSSSWPQQFHRRAREAGQRLDVFLAEQLPAFSRATLRRAIDAGHVRVDDAAVQGVAATARGQPGRRSANRRAARRAGAAGHSARRSCTRTMRSSSSTSRPA